MFFAGIASQTLAVSCVLIVSTLLIWGSSASSLGAQWLTVIIPALRRLRQEDCHEFKTHLGDLGLHHEEFREFTLLTWEL